MGTPCWSGGSNGMRNWPRAEKEERVLVCGGLAPPGRVPRGAPRSALGTGGGRRHRRAPGAVPLPPTGGRRPAGLPAGHDLRRPVDRDRRVLHHRPGRDADRWHDARPRPRPRPDPHPRQRRRPGPRQPCDRGCPADHRRRLLLRPRRVRHDHQPQLRRPRAARRQAVAAQRTGHHRPGQLDRHRSGEYSRAPGWAATWWSRPAPSYGARSPTTRWWPGRPPRNRPLLGPGGRLAAAAAHPRAGADTRR
ncbi:hypothetical protein SRIMM317S_04176 [Streptomyces rimosus subsp. rimosus]